GFRDPAASNAKYQAYLEQWYQLHDKGTASAPVFTGKPWFDAELDDTAWGAAKQPGAWEDSGMPGFDGVVWMRRTFDLPADWKDVGAELSLGPIDDSDTTWINGQRIGATAGYDVPRHYKIPTGILKPGRNQITVRVLDTGGNGGFTGTADQMFITPTGGAALSLAGLWKREASLTFPDAPKPREYVNAGPGAPSVLFNGMLYPIIPYTIRGVIWYQGEANSDRANEYQKLFPAMIADWRKLWRLGDFPFLFVQIAPFETMRPEIREAQLLTLERSPKTAMAVTLDVGSPHNIHPGNKEPVGDRLALAARALAYHEHIEYSGPLFAGAKFHDGQATVEFTHAGHGLAVKGDSLVGFTLAGQDGVFHPAKAVIDGKKLIVTADGVTHATAVRYAWANIPTGNLYNVDGLPASPFRSDVEKTK
ncbi:MAG TPA: sialate O-acetylesterase, partial [Opitutaceae bacterium]